jgi:predicted DsbA family dithiol-disulfide isomerase
LGLEESEIRDVLESDAYDFEVRIEEEEAIVMGIEAIPLYFLNVSEEQLIVPGAFEKEDFKIALIDLMNGEIESKSYI